MSSSGTTPSDPSPSSPSKLENRVMERLGIEIAYASVRPDLTISQYSPQLRNLAIDLEKDADLVGFHVFDVFAELVGLDDALQSLLAGNISELRLPAVNRQSANSDEPLRYYDFLLFAIDSTQPDAGLILLIEDVTDQARLQQELVQERNQLRLMQAELAQANSRLQHLDQIKTLFLSMAAHDMRTPLAVIKGYLDFMEEDFADGSDVLQQDIRIMQDQINWLNRLINDILDLNLIENGLLAVNFEQFDLRFAVEEVIKAMQQIATSERKIIEAKMPDETVMIWAEPDRIVQILLNLVSNSFKFIQNNGRVTIHVNVDEERRRAYLRVEDDGPGIDEAHQRHLFKLFYRTPDSKKIQGVGLGLYIVHTLVEQHNGKIWVESKLKKGTTFVIELPLLTRQSETKKE